MKVLVVNTAAPFVRGGAEELADHLVARLTATEGVESELVRLPFRWVPSERLIEEILVARGLRIENTDRVIALKFPAYLIPHEHKILWVLHQFRQAYDLGDVGQGLAAEGRDGELRAAIAAADNGAFAEARALFVNSPVTRERMLKYNGFAAQVLYPPMNDDHLFVGGASQGYVFAGGRVSPGKRQHLLIEALARVRGGARLIIAGPPDSDDYAQTLRDLVARHDLQSRVELRFGFHPRGEIAAWVNGALACACLPYDEDSLSYVAMEAFCAGKPVLTANDCGGLLEMVTSETGIVAEPEPVSLGEAARAAWRARGITWPDTINRLLS